MAGEPYLSEYYQALDDAAYVWGTDVAEMDRVLGKWDLTPEQIQTDWVDGRSISNGKTKILAGKDGSLRFRTVDIESNVPSTSVNSNSVIKRKWSVPVNSTINQSTGKVVMKAGLREAGNFFMGSIIPATAAASVGISLGKAFDSALYNLAPDFFDAHGMETLNPETWNSITGNDTILGTIFNTVFGLDGNGETTMYLDEDTLGYLSWWLRDAGAFGGNQIDDVPVEVGTNVEDNLLKMPLESFINTYVMPGSHSDFSQDDLIETFFTNHPEFSPGDIGIVMNDSTSIYWYRPVAPILGDYEISSVSGGVGTITPSLSFQRDGYFKSYTNGSTPGTLFTYNTQTGTISGSTAGNIATITEARKFILGHFIPATPGISNQPDATVPDSSSWNSPSDAVNSIRQQLPQLWDGAKHYDYVDNGQQKTKTLLPIPITNTKSPTDTQPTSDDRVQDVPQIDPDTDTDTLIDTITKIITDRITNIPTTNPPDTGSGSTPTVVPPTGEASSLWAIYNPTQAQLDAFGSWLWSSNFVEQIKKLFNDPMQAIVGVHKVFATPPTNGQVNIKCGYIDSGCPAAKVTGQYVTVDCGTVGVYERFVNVFDYPPYTEIHLYLPFIGIVKLDCSDVMRGRVQVKYHVDVITGACLADVIIKRDGVDQTIYQYSGSAIVTYPISSGSYANMVTGVLSLAAGIAGTVATGGAAAPALIGGAVGLTHLHTDVQKSGSFSGSPGAMGGKKPYLILSRPQTSLPSDFEKYEGKPASKTVKLGNCDGFVRVKQINIDAIPRATYGELDQIVALLKQGVII